MTWRDLLPAQPGGRGKNPGEREHPEPEGDAGRLRRQPGLGGRRGLLRRGLFGADRDRPGWNAMLAAAERREFQIVLCKTQSRFTRDMGARGKIPPRAVPAVGRPVRGGGGPRRHRPQGQQKGRQINGLINEWYLEDLSENIRAVFAQKRSAGKYIGSIPAYGYRKDPADHNHLVVEPEAAEVVRSIFSLCLEGFGKQKIAALLNERGIPSPSAYKRARGWTRGEAGADGWNRTTVGRILRSELYTGTMVQGTKRRVSYKSKACAGVPKEAWCRVEGTHEAIVEPGVLRRGAGAA